MYPKGLKKTNLQPQYKIFQEICGHGNIDFGGLDPKQSLSLSLSVFN